MSSLTQHWQHLKKYIKDQYYLLLFIVLVVVGVAIINNLCYTKVLQLLSITIVRRPGWNDPMMAVVPRVKGFACYGLSFSRHNNNIKMEHFFLYILSRYFI